ncbi:hypothetical protein [Moraxella oblonga]|uniref:hypothetical protein n=1 Tax=Moraxella oblonga TaxID=200413 RepID=UPI0008335839|nr:hypothetical protein [Moraxella oblonga]
MKIKALLLGTLLLTNLTFAQYLCTYEAHITNSDKINSSGKNLATGNTKASAAAILQQDRADFWNGVSDETGEADCYFDSKANRQTMSQKLSRGSISQTTINRIVNKGGYFTVDVYSTHIDVR